MACLLSSMALRTSLLACRQLLFCSQEPLPDWEPLGFPHGNLICALGKGDRYHVASEPVRETAQVHRVNVN